MAADHAPLVLFLHIVWPAPTSTKAERHGSKECGKYLRYLFMGSLCRSNEDGTARLRRVAGAQLRRSTGEES